METETRPQNLWEFLEDETKNHPEEVKALFEWSLNFDHDQRPFNLMLDLIGWSEDNYGVSMAKNVRLGYLEADYLSDALKEWAMYPQQVETWIDRLMATEG